jgi:hypothetical protein
MYTAHLCGSSASNSQVVEKKSTEKKNIKGEEDKIESPEREEE